MDANKSSQQVIKEANIRMIFRLIHKNESISRADLKKMTGLSATTVSTLVEELANAGLVAEAGIKETKTSGRKAVALKICSDGGYFVGLDVQKNNVVADVYGLDFSHKEHIEVSVSAGESFGTKIMNTISRATRGRKILGITIGLPGVIDPVTNTLISSTVLPAEDAKDIYGILKDALGGINVCLKNNSGLIALAEREFGGYIDTNNLISIDINDGVGAGILIDGAIYSGSGMAGEFGHLTVDYNGERCKCGNFGCLELYASIPAIQEKTKTKSLPELVKKLSAGDKGCLETVKNVSRALAFGINNIVNLLNPELIIIGGAIKSLGEYFLDPLKEVTNQIALIKDTKIEFSKINGNPVTLGGAKYSFDEVFGK